MLDDNDGDGFFETATVFADNLRSPRACSRGKAACS